jgi:hypothetical protein
VNPAKTKIELWSDSEHMEFPKVGIMALRRDMKHFLGITEKWASNKLPLNLIGNIKL